MSIDEISDFLLQDYEQIQFSHKIKMRYRYGLTYSYEAGDLFVTNKKIILFIKQWVIYPRFIIISRNRIKEVGLKKDFIAIKWVLNKVRGKTEFRIREKDKTKRRTLIKEIYENLTQTNSSQTV
ncbi:MAG: hypothetical protein ACFFCM_15980 [Promethearchaeota archaeon]